MKHPIQIINAAINKIKRKYFDWFFNKFYYSTAILLFFYYTQELQKYVTVLALHYAGILSLKT
jgi:hypothetical protein